MQAPEGYGSHVCVCVCVCVCACVCLFVCLLSYISPLECLFVLKLLSRTQQATGIKKFVGFSLKLLHCRAMALPALYGYRAVSHFLTAEYACELSIIQPIPTVSVAQACECNMQHFCYNDSVPA